MGDTPPSREKDNEDTPKYILEFQENRILFSGALGVSIVAFTGMLQFSWEEIASDLALFITFGCLIVSIPVNAMSIYLTTFAIQRKTNLHLRKSVISIGTLGGLITTLGALTGLFWHFHWVAGFSFLLISCVATAFALLERSKHP